MERTSREFKFVDTLDELELYCNPCQYLGESWNDEQLDFEIEACERNTNNHIVFDVKVSSSERNVENVAEQSIFAMCLKYFWWNTRITTTRTLIVTYNGDLINFKGHRWCDTYTYELALVSPLHGNKWLLVIIYDAEELLDTLDIAQAFEREFKCQVQVTINLNHAMLRMIEDVYTQKGLDLDVKSIEE